MKLVIVLFTLLSCYVQCARMNPSVNVLVGTTVFSSIENRGHIRQCTIEYIEGKSKDGGIGSYIRNCTRNDPTPPSEGPGNHSVSGGHFIERNEGEEADFVCDVHGMRKNDTFFWHGPRQGRKGVFPLYIHQRGQEIYPQGSRRFSFSNENRTKWQMKIRQIARGDAGEYQCAVQSTNSAGIDHVENASFHLTVNYDVYITGILPNRFPHVRDGQENIIYFNETENATVVCLSDGRPEPKNFWRKGEEIISVGGHGTDKECLTGFGQEWRQDSPPGGQAPPGEGVGQQPGAPTKATTNNHTIYNISKKDEGLYCCESRQTWTEDERNVTIVVQHRPITTVNQPIIRSKRGKSVNLECRFDSDPLPPTAEWYRKGKVLNGAGPTLRYSSSFYIDSLDPQKHYGNYTCVVSNILGSSECRFEITGRPDKPTVTSPRKGSRKRVYTLEWTFEVYDVKTIDRFWVYYTKKDNYRGSPRDMLKLPVEPVAPDPRRPMHYKTTLHDLWDNATYCVELFAENKYGQGDTEYFEFRTADKDAPTPKPTLEPPPTPAGQHNGEERQARASVTISIVTAMLIAGVLQS